MRNFSNSSLPHNRYLAGGFTLLELLIALVVLAIGVMGVIALQVSTYQQLQTSHNYSKAAMLASDMADRILANREEAIDGKYNHNTLPGSEPSPNCAQAPCSAAQLAAYDVWAWQTELAARDPDDPTRSIPGSLPAASGEVYRDAASGEYLVLVRWDDDLSGSSGTECAALDPDTVHNPDDLDCFALNLGCLRAGPSCAPPPP